MHMGSNSSSAVAPAPGLASPTGVTIHVPNDNGLSGALPAGAVERPASPVPVLSTHLADVARPPIHVQPAPQAAPQAGAGTGGLVYTLPSLADAQAAVQQQNGGAANGQHTHTTGTFASADSASGAVSASNHSNPGTPAFRAADTPKNGDEQARNSAYALELQRQKRLLPAVPNVAITFHDLSVSVQVPVVDRGFETVGGRMWNTVTFAGLRGKNRTKQFDMIAGATGVIRPGSLTLILAPPGHGKSTLLKALATRVKATAGAVRYNGLTEAEALEKGIFVNKLVQYVDQADVHNPLLTVHETFQFAVDNFCVDPTLLPDQSALSHDHKAQLQKLHETKAEAMVATLGLGECRDTILGNALLRGVSGGQKKRVTLGETLLSEARVLCLDEVTNGLDSSTALDIFRSLRTWCQVTGGSVVAALQQPTPELFGLFDELVLLKEGHTVYTGPATQAIPYLESIGYVCPQDSDFCDFMVEFLTHPKFVLQLQNVRASMASPPAVAGPGPYAQAFNSGAIDSSASASEHKGQPGVEMQPLKTPATADVQAGPQGWVPSTTLELVKQFADTHIAKDQLVQIAASERSTPKASAAGGMLLNDYCRALYGSQYAHSFGYSLLKNVSRQRMLNGRNKGLTGPRVGQAVMMSLLLGSLFYDTGVTQFPERIALILFALTFVAFGNMSELPIAVEAKRVLYKQTDAGMFPVAVYVVGVVLCHLPLLIMETTIFTIVLYFLTSFTHNAGAFFIFLAIMYCSGLCMSVFFRMLAYVAPNEEIAQAMAGPSTGIFMLFGGFFITRNSVPDFMIWLYWLSPFSWSVRSLAVNEFRQDRYKEYVNPVNGRVVDIGQLYLDTYEMQSQSEWVWNGPLLLLGYFAALTILSVVVLQYKRYELSRGTKRFEEETHANGNGHGKRASSGDANPAHAADAHASAAAGALPFTPVTLSFKEIHYTIVDDKGHKKKLLANVSGYAKPKTLTALMGVSGAGKTTLMDVIAGRKTQGTIEGDILVNGKKVSAAKFARLSGYVEQDDIHNPTATVRETLLFAAALRLPESVSSAVKEQFVDEILELLELKDISDQIIGNAVILGLAPGQLKRVTIGVELVANPTILFLDEPTTGLDSRSAYTVMRVIKKIAASGRSVVCTIHQPSAELFYMFDALLLLAPGGVQTYFGSVGYRARGLVQYFEGLGAPRKPRRMNPASWMLDVIGAGTGANASVSVALDVKSAADGKAEVTVAKPAVDFGVAYSQSTLFKHCDEQLALLTQGVAGGGAGGSIGNEAELTRYATGISTQFYHYMIRLFRSYWRNLPFIWNRGVVLLVLSIVFGLVYFDLKSDTQGNVLSKISVMFVTGGFAGIIHSATSLPVLMDQRAVYYRERSANTYMSVVYSISIFIVELPFVAAYNAMFLAIAYSMIGLEDNSTAWGKYYFAHIMLSYCYVSMAHFLTSVMPNKLVAGIVQGMYFSMFFLFGGMLVNGSNVPAGWKWMWHITPVHHALESLVMPQFEGATQLIPIVVGADTIQMPVRDFVSSYLAFDYGNYYGPLGWLALFILVMRCLVILCMEKVSFIKR